MMNPFDLPGPQFLLWYLSFTALLIGLAILLRRRLESGPIPKLGETDPFLIAYLRGGANEAIRVATLALFDRQLLKAQGEVLHAEQDAAQRVRRPLERAILAAFRAPAPASSAFGDREARKACKALKEQLRELGLIPTSSQIAMRAVIGVVVLLILWCIAAMKLDIAEARGKQNVGFLNFLIDVMPVVVLLALASRRTATGQRMLKDIQTLFGGLKERASSIQIGGATSELVFLAGVFGIGALSGPALVESRILFPKAAKSDSASCGASCGSSCGSSCGGGGCGGGCGGCGG